MAPGDVSSKPVDVTNSGAVSRFVSVKGVRTGGVGADPKLETVLDLVISDGSTPIYGPKTLADFFNESLSPSGVMLNIINPGGHKTYNFEVTLPSSAGNEFQAKSVIFDLTFGVITGSNLVINEVYYLVDSSHGSDSPKDRVPARGQKLGHNDEWVEIYNPTNRDVSLKNWTLTDNSGKPTVIHANKKIKAGGFALISKDSSLWKYWGKIKKAEKIELGNQIGDGLDNSGDRLILRDNKGVEIDRMSWGSDTSGFTPPAVNPVVSLGSSTERLAPGLDTDRASDWEQQTPPSPGS